MFLERSMSQADGIGWIEVICGSMFSGKTEELLRRVKRAKIAKQKIKIFKPKKDVRYDKKKVISHDQNSIKSKPVSNPGKIIKLSEKFEVIGIDEAQFFDDSLVDVCNELANLGKRVIVSGLDMDYKGKPFGPMPNLLAIAEYVTKVHAVCSKSGKMASYTHRIVDSDDLILLGDTKKYQALSRKEFIKSNTTKKT
ncbi:MAG: thymidine kinase [Flammeovirgaceae bacterium]|jgi:thymidine kinase|nr:thymidine kinase [Flammeovirgaceae bacterium]|tara:strand:- start:837 stop:1424 length:588 start_codon:yes stop_codon:yes gene_type:complete